MCATLKASDRARRGERGGSGTSRVDHGMSGQRPGALVPGKPVFPVGAVEMHAPTGLARTVEFSAMRRLPPDMCQATDPQVRAERIYPLSLWRKSTALVSKCLLAAQNVAVCSRVNTQCPEVSRATLRFQPLRAGTDAL